MQYASRNIGSGPWAMRLSLWRQHGGAIVPMVTALVEWFALRAVFVIGDEDAFWKIAAINSALALVMVALTHLRVERTIRFLASVPSSPTTTACGHAPPYRTAVSTADDMGRVSLRIAAMAPASPYRTTAACPPCGDVVRREAVAPFASHDADALNAEYDARYRALEPLSGEERRLMSALLIERKFMVGLLVDRPRDGSAS